MYDNLRNAHHWVLPEVLAYQSRTQGDKAFVTMVDGDTLSYAEAEADAAKVAGFLDTLGVGIGDTVAVMAPNSLDFIRIWMGIGRLGATMVPLNADLKSTFLEHQLRNAAPKVALFHQIHLEALSEVAPRIAGLEQVVVINATSTTLASAAPRYLAFDAWRNSPSYLGPIPTARDIACIMYTSGTTGPSKGVLMPHAHCYLFGLGIVDNHTLTSDDRYYITLPLFHANGLFMQLYGTLIAGGTAVIRGRFSASSWLADVSRYHCTVTNILGSMSTFVFSHPPTAADRDHCLRIVHSAPNPQEHEQVWRERFGVTDVLSGFGMTEVNIPVYGRLGESRPGVAGYVYSPYFEVEIRDPETDQPVPPETVGEIMVRPRIPFGFMAGYHSMPDKTVEAWRNFWFHTGDAGIMTQDGCVSFLDRIKDCIRRRGENISSFEVEAAVTRLEGVQEVAAFAVPADSPGGEDEVMLAVIPEAGANLTPECVSHFAATELPRFAQPRYIEIVTTLPRTPTAKVQKGLLRNRGVTSTTWDREKADF